jgi:hypothetical protein
MRMPAKAGRETGLVKMLTTGELAGILRMSRWTLQDWRKRRVGPPWIKLSRQCVRYPLPALVYYLRQHLEGGKERRARVTETVGARCQISSAGS